MEPHFYVTTPIYYVNDKPHIGHAYTTILADVLARYHRLLGMPTHFLTGTDEHGQKVEKAARAQGMSPKEQCDTTVIRFQELWTKLGITNDDFIRTTEPRHTKIVQKVLQELFDKDLIYKAEYQGHYCVPCERFFTEKDLIDGNLCPECKRPVDPIVESNYFFRMGQYKDWLVDYIQTHPEFIQPSFRANETLGFLKGNLGDLCISRPKSRLSWGIELPFDKDYVCYVWFDALLNYVSAVGYGSDDVEFKKWWPCSYHLIGKDILTTHTVYWPTMLHAMGLPMPQSIFAHGWWLIGQDKMSKSLGNVVNPMEMCEKYGVDAFRYVLLSEMTLGQDASFTENVFVTRYNSDLANDLGNFVSRVLKMIGKNFDSKIPVCGELQTIDTDFIAEVQRAIPLLTESVEKMRIDKGIAAVIESIRAANRYFDKTAPWTLAKNNDTARLGTVLYVAAEALRIVSVALTPLMPEKMKVLQASLGLSENEHVMFADVVKFGQLHSGAAITDPGALFQRIEVLKTESTPAPVKEKAPKAPKKSVEVLPEGIITIDDFKKVQLRVVKIVHVEKVPNSEKLLRIEVEIGEEKRQIVAGISAFYTPEELIGQTVVAVTNLKPTRLCGVESRGMLLAAFHEGQLSLISPAREIPSGAEIG